MKQLPVILMALIIAACSNNAPKGETTHEGGHEQHDTAVNKTSAVLQLNNGAKWKTDEATRRNVAAMSQVISDSRSIDKRNIPVLVQQLQTRVDTLVLECKMKGAEHDALHVWLEKVLHDLKEVKEEKGGEYQTAYAALKKDIDSFYVFFE